jgi:hypothetical protein
MYRSRLVPRILPVLGFSGAPLLVTAVAGTLFGLWGPVSVLSGFGALFLSFWEFSLGVWLIVKGFRPSPITVELAIASEVSR